MSNKNYNELSTSILKLVGGSENVTHLLHCATRLRFNLADYDRADIEALKKLEGVLGLRKSAISFRSLSDRMSPLSATPSWKN